MSGRYLEATISSKNFFVFFSSFCLFLDSDDPFLPLSYVYAAREMKRKGIGSDNLVSAFKKCQRIVFIAMFYLSLFGHLFSVMFVNFFSDIKIKNVFKTPSYAILKL